MDFGDANLSQLRDAKYEVIFAHPEAFITCKQGIEFFQSEKYQTNVHAIVIEAHCLLQLKGDLLSTEKFETLIKHRLIGCLLIFL